MVDTSKGFVTVLRAWLLLKAKRHVQMQRVYSLPVDILANLVVSER